MIYVVASLSFLNFLMSIVTIVFLFVLWRKTRSIVDSSELVADRTSFVDKAVKAEGEAMASMMEYIAAFQGEDLLFNQDLRENASSHLMQLQQTLRNKLEDANAK